MLILTGKIQQFPLFPATPFFYIVLPPKIILYFIIFLSGNFFRGWAQEGGESNKSPITPHSPLVLYRFTPLNLPPNITSFVCFVGGGVMFGGKI